MENLNPLHWFKYLLFGKKKKKESDQNVLNIQRLSRTSKSISTLYSNN